MRYYDHIHQINDKQQLLLDSPNGLSVPYSTLDNDFSLWSIHTSNLLWKIRHVVVLFHLPIVL